MKLDLSLPVHEAVFKFNSSLLNELRKANIRDLIMSSDNKLAQVLANNVQWSKDVSATVPDFFTQLAKGQTPKV